MANEAGCCEGEGRAATVAVLVLSVIVFMVNIYAMLAATGIHAYYWIMTYHLVGTIGVMVATSVYACRCCGEGGFPLRRLGQALAAYVALCGVVCFVVVLAAKDGAIEDNCAETRKCDASYLIGCPKENQNFHQCADDPNFLEEILDIDACGGGKLYAPKWHNYCDNKNYDYCRTFCTKKACTDYCNPLSDHDKDQCGDRSDCYTITQFLEQHVIPTCIFLILFLLVPAAALAGVAVQAKEPERVNPSHPSIEMPPIVAAVPLPAGMQPYQAQPGQPPQMVPAPVMATVQEPQAKVVNEANATML